MRTYHGIDVCGTRLVKDVKEFIAKCQDEEKKQITAISFVGTYVCLASTRWRREE